MKYISYFEKLKSISGLSLSLAKANFKLRNEGSYLGILWYLLEPLLLFLIILLIRNNFGANSIDHYFIYLLLGLIMFNFFTGATGLAINSIFSNEGFIKSINIPYEALVISSVLQAVYSHFFEILVLTIFLLFLGPSFLFIIFYPFILSFFIIFILGLSFILATIGSYIHDAKNVWVVLTRLLWFITPVFYTISPGTNIHLINLFNPIYYFISISRKVIIFHNIPDIWEVLITIIFSLLFLVVGLIIFNKYKSKFAEVI